jgi:uncharacterized protein (TIGR03546 family)
MIEMIARVLKILNSESEPGQISLALCLSMMVGLTPLYSLHNLLMLLLVLILRVNLSAFLLGWLLFSAIAYLLDPLFHSIGLNVLRADALEPLWTALYNLTLFRLARFNNTIVMGSLLFSLAMFIPLYIFSNFLIVKYRDHILSWIRNTRIMTAVKASKFYSAYERLSGWGGIA